MIRVHCAECNMAHAGNFVIDVPVGTQWLMVMTKTPARFRVDGELRVYPAQSAVLYRPGQSVHYETYDGHFVNNWIRFETDDPYFVDSPLPFGIPFPLEDPDTCDKLFQLIAAEQRFDRSFKTSSLTFLLRTLLNKLLESSRHKHIQPHHYELMRLRTAIQNEPNREWTVPMMADMLGVSPGYLQDRYRKAFGVSCMEDVIQNRIRLAKEYLLLSRMSIGEIASYCGYQHVEHFSRQFRKVTGFSPREFQKMHARDH